MKPLFSDKSRLPVNVTLVKENDVISDNGKIADVLNINHNHCHNHQRLFSGNVFGFSQFF